MDKKNINIKVLEKQLINNLEQTINDKMILNSFIKGLRVVSFDEKKIILFVNSKESKKTIEKYYLDIFQKAIKNILNLSLKIKFVLNSESLLYEEKKINSHINPNLNFDSYVISKFNESVIKISKTIIKKIGKYSPFYISSKSGLGKTHLLHAIGNKLLKKNINTLYIEPNRFTEKITKLSNKKDGISNYINNLKKYDVILFDDIQIMGDKVVTLKVLFQIVNYFVENKKQIIITSDKVAQELSGFEERFITRFESGISEKINKLKIEDVSKILIKKLEEENLNPKKWEKEAINFIARNNTSSIRMLEGAIKRIGFYMENKNNVKYTYNIISNIFKNLEIDQSELTPSRIISVIANYYKINKSDIKGKSRKKEFVFPRHVSIYLIRQMTNLSQKEIGRIFGNRDHSTIINAIKNIDKKIKIDKAHKLAIEQIERKIKKIS